MDRNFALLKALSHIQATDEPGVKYKRNSNYFLNRQRYRLKRKLRRRARKVMAKASRRRNRS